MLKSKKAKIIIGILGILIVLIASSIWVSFTFRSNSVNDFEYDTMANNDTSLGTKTQIDNIIDMSNTANSSTEEGYDTSNYYIYIITPKGKSPSSAVQDFMTSASNGFRDEIINNNRTIDATMPEGKIVCKVYDVSNLNSMDATSLSTELGKADMIYLYTDSVLSYSAEGSQIGENLYEFLGRYMTDKPVIINYALKDSGSKDDDEPDVPVTPGTVSRTYTMTTQDFKLSWKRTQTVNISNWTKNTLEVNTVNVLKAYITSMWFSRYEVGSTVPAGYATWADYWKRTAISSGSGGDPATEAVATMNILFIYGNDTDASGIADLGTWLAGDGKSAFFSRNTEAANMPTEYKVEAVRADALTIDSFYVKDAEGNRIKAPDNTDVKKYDLILIAPHDYTSHDISEDVRTTMNTLSTDTNGVTYILFGTLPDTSGSSGGSGSGGSGTSENITIDVSTNFGKLVDSAITTTGYAKINNALVIGFDFMDTLANAPDKNQTKVTKIVNLINKSRFRTFSGGGSGGISGSTSTTAYRVLELQPCYPIDLDVAYSSTVTLGQHPAKYTIKGNYYTIPANVVSGVSEDDVAPGIEYYKWDLSVAKLSYALGIPASNIELVQMSTAEFVTSKADAATAYDLIYIGGNKSALKPVDWYGFITDQSAPQYNGSLTRYSMYSHSGELFDNLQQGSGIDSKKIVYSGDEYKYIQLNGNDITYDRYEQLKQYIDSGRPIIVGDELWDRYEEAKSLVNPKTNTWIDVDSNMYALLDYLQAQSNDGKKNILTGWANRIPRSVASADLWKDGITTAEKDTYLNEYYVEVKESQLKDNPNGDYQTHTIENAQEMYGSAGTVTVWNDALNKQLSDLVFKDSYIRPKYTVTTNAVSYKSNDESTKLKTIDLVNGNLYWKIKLENPIEGHQYQAVLLEDLNDNADFDLKTEKLSAVAFTPNNGTGDMEAELTYAVPSSFWGAISWQVVVMDVTFTEGNVSDLALSNGTADISCIDREDKEKKSATILEIMPLSLAANGNYNNKSANGARKDTAGFQKGEAIQDGHSLYLDVNYQQGAGNDFLYSSLDDTGYYDTNKQITDVKTYQYSGIPGGKGYAFTTWANDSSFYNYSSTGSARTIENSGNVELGLYQTRLSINRFDTTNNREDWGYNYIDEIANDYDLTLDIMYLDDIEYYAYQANHLTDTQRSDYAEMAGEAYGKYMSYMQPNYLKTYTNVGTDIDPYKDYTDKEKDLRQLMQDIYDGKKGITMNETERYALKTALDSGDYFRMFYSSAIGSYVRYNNTGLAKEIRDTYEAYRLVNDEKITSYRAWRHYSLLSYGPEEFLRRNYDVICFGFLDDLFAAYDYSDAACEAFNYFINPVEKAGVPEDEQLKPGSILLTHDCMSKFAESGYSLNFTSKFRELVGMDRFHDVKTLNENGTDSKTFVEYYNPELSTAEREARGLTNDAAYENYMSKRYFVTSISSDYNFGKSSTYTLEQWKTASNDFVTATMSGGYGNSFLSKMNNGVGLTLYPVGEKNTKLGYEGLTNAIAIKLSGTCVSYPYTYEEFSVTTQMAWNVDPAKALTLTGTSKAEQVNRGIVTTYPFYIKPDLRISPTHVQTLALDMEDSSVTTWYTLAADNLQTSGNSVKAASVDDSPNYSQLKGNSSSYAAAPKDGVNNYYIYSKGNITYCGAGHGAITGPDRDNNDERRLFINVLVNLVNKSTKTEIVLRPRIDLYDPDGTLAPNGKVIKQDITGEYYINVNGINTYPEFGFGLRDMNIGQTVTDIQIYYDLDYVVPTGSAAADNDYSSAKDVLIPIPGEKSDLIDYLNGETSDGKKNVYQIDSVLWPGMVTQKEYFDAYDGTYTYIVIKMTVSGSTEPLYRRIRINLKESLLDLT